MKNKLTQKEKMILFLFVRGYTGKEINEMFSDLSLQQIREIKKSFIAKLSVDI